MSGIRIGSPVSGGGFHDLERSATPPSSYRDQPLIAATTFGDDGSGGGAVVVTPTGADGYRDDPRHVGYRDYEGGDEDGEDAPSHSLPHVDDVRMRAMSIINAGGRDGHTSSSVVAPASIFFCFAHLCTTRSGWLCMLLMVSIFIVSLTIGLHNKNNDNGGSANGNLGNNKDPSAFPYAGFTFVSDKEQQIVRYLLDVSDYRQLNNTSSAQRRAAQWLAVEDTTNLAIPDLGRIDVQTEDIPLLQRYAILTLYYSLQGPTWNKRGKSLSWLVPGSHECNWNRPIATMPTDDNTDDDVPSATLPSESLPEEILQPTVLGVACNSNKVVTEIWLDGVNSNKRSASLPNEIALLPVLQKLNLNNNNIYGIPKSLSKVTTLRLLSMAKNPNFKGTIPFASIPMEQLRYLDLSACNLTGVIPEQDYVPRLKYLYLSNNQLTGTLPQAMAGWTNLQVLALDRNQLGGPLPPTLSALYKLEQVYLEFNNFGGTLDGLYSSGQNTRLQTFDVSNNDLGGTIPSSLFTISSLKTLDLHINKFTGKLPRKIGEECLIEYITVKGNHLTSSIPFEWGRLRKLTHLDVSQTNMRGVIPETFEALTQLAFLYMTDYEIEHARGHNVLESSFPVALQSLTNLRELGLHNTGLTGPIPTWIGELKSLRVLALDGNALNGTIPPEMGNLSLLRILLLEKNNLQGTIPTEFEKLTKLQALLVQVNDGMNGTVTNSSAVCEKGLDVFIADCGDTNKPQIACECCTSCCKGSFDTSCLKEEFYVEDRDNWRQGYNNPIKYTFGGTSVIVGTAD